MSSVLEGSLQLCLGMWIIAGDWFVLCVPLCVLQDVFSFPKGTPVVWTCSALLQSLCASNVLCEMIAPKVAHFPGMVSVSQKEAVERESKAEPAPRTAKRYYS